MKKLKSDKYINRYTNLIKPLLPNGFVVKVTYRNTPFTSESGLGVFFSYDEYRHALFVYEQELNSIYNYEIIKAAERIINVLIKLKESK